jgi:pimeloyl-ACP methyl ester carboxylesterase
MARSLERPVVAYDRLGFGRSTARESPPSLDFVAEEADEVFPELCRRLGLKRFSLFGHSVCGAMAQWVLDAWTKVWLDPVFASWSLDPHLGRVECPVLAIHGDSDEFSSTEFPRTITKGVAGPAEMAILEGCRHVSHRE